MAHTALAMALILCTGVALGDNADAKICADWTCPDGEVHFYYKLNIANPSHKDCCQATCKIYEECKEGFVVNPKKLDSTLFTEKNCCAKTCGAYTCPDKFKVDPSVKSDTEVSDEHCCKATCDLFPCPTGYKHTMNSEIGDTQEACCQETCAAFTCEPGFKKKPEELGTTNPTNGKCCEETCAIATVKDCAPPLGVKSWEAWDDKAEKSTDVLWAQGCCKGICEGTSCSSGWVLNEAHLNRTEGKTGSALTPESCCVQTCEAPEHECKEGWAKDPAKSSRMSISDENCCRPTCRTFNCKAGTSLIESNFNEADEVNQEKCCTPTCDGFTCSTGWSPKFDADGIQAASDQECCVKTCDITPCEHGFVKNVKQKTSNVTTNENCCLKTCAVYECPKGYNNKDANKDSTLLSDAMCCLPTCARHSCPPDAKLNQGMLTKTPTSMNDQACCEKTCRSIKCKAGFEPNQKTLDNISPTEEKCCTDTYVDVTDWFCQGGAMQEQLQMKKDSEDVKVKCCCLGETGKCKLGKVGFGRNGCLQIAAWEQWAGAKDYHKFSEAGAKCMAEYTGKKCMIPYLDSDSWGSYDRSIAQ